jgi:hypothetical protein
VDLEAQSCWETRAWPPALEHWPPGPVAKVGLLPLWSLVQVSGGFISQFIQRL